MTSLSHSDLKVMSIVWSSGGEASASDICRVLSSNYSRGAIYSFIRSCVAKGALERVDPGYICRAKVDREDVRLLETKGLIERLYDGSVEELLVSLVKPGSVSSEEIGRLRALVRDAYIDIDGAEGE
jgi:predicted transcriptional regulator